MMFGLQLAAGGWYTGWTEADVPPSAFYIAKVFQPPFGYSTQIYAGDYARQALLEWALGVADDVPTAAKWFSRVTLRSAV